MNESGANMRIELNRGDVEASAASQHALTYKGFGVLSANATSSLLLDYKTAHPEVYWRLIDALFAGPRPLMRLIKVEMGNDRNNSTGPDPASMRSADEPANVLRDPGFQLAADAKTRQPDLHVSVLRWQPPAWVRDNDDIYHWYKTTILAVYRHFGYMVDSLNPHINERPTDLDWAVEFKRRLTQDCSGFADETERRLFSRIRIIVSDEESVGSFGPELLARDDAMKAVDVAAYHYSAADDVSGSFTALADQHDKAIWNSEAQAVFSCSADRPNNTMDDGRSGHGTGLGGAFSALEMANMLVKQFTESRRTMTIYQPAIGAFFEGLQYSSKELVSMRDPWSGWIYYDAGCAVLEHFAKCADLGWDTDHAWRAVPQASRCEVDGMRPVDGGRDGEPSFLTLAAPDGSDCSTVIVNNSALPRTYTLSIDPALRACSKPLHVWQTRAAEPGERYDARYRCHTEVLSAGATHAIRVEPWSVTTVTTLDDVEEYAIDATGEGMRAVLDLDPDGDGMLYTDDFDGANSANGIAPRYVTCTNGAFEFEPETDGTVTLRQQIGRLATPNAWIGGDPRLSIGDWRWTNYRVEVEVRFEPGFGVSAYAGVGMREMGGSPSMQDAAAYDLRLRPDGSWLLRRFGWEVRWGRLADLQSAGAGFEASGFNRIGLEGRDGSIRAFVNGVCVASFEDSAAQTAGRVQLQSSFDHVRFRGLRVSKLPGTFAHYRDLIDDMHMVSWDDSRTPVLEYSGDWRHENAQSMWALGRTLSVAGSPGAALTIRGVREALDVFGPSDGAARVTVLVDGQPWEQALPVHATNGPLRCQLSLRGLADGCAVTLVSVGDAPLIIDALGVR